MRRIQIYIDEALDDTLQIEAASSGRSKAALIRECVESRFNVRKQVRQDPLDALVGALEVEPAEVDDVVYER